MPTTTRPDPNDPYYIASVPMYCDFRTLDDHNDSIGDRFFEVIGNTLDSPVQQEPENRPAPSMGSPQQPTQKGRHSVMSAISAAVDAIEKGAPIPKVQAKPRPVSRKSIAAASAKNETSTSSNAAKNGTSVSSTAANSRTSISSTAVKQPVHRPWNLRSSTPNASSAGQPPAGGFEVTGNTLDSPDPIPKVQAKPRPVSRRSIAAASANDGTSISTTAANSRTSISSNAAKNGTSVSSTAANSRTSISSTAVKQPAHRPWNLRSSTSNASSASQPPAGGSIASVKRTQHPVNKPAIVQPPMRFGSASSVVQPPSVVAQSSVKRTQHPTNKPAIVQPPMRFGNVQTRRSVMPVETPKREPSQERAKAQTRRSVMPVETPKREPGQERAKSMAKALGVSHAVRGIKVTPTKAQKDE